MFQLFSGAFLAGAARFILSSLGIGVVTFIGTEAVLNQLVSYAQSQIGGAGGAGAAIAGLMGIPEGISLLASAYAVRLATAALRRFRLL